MEQSLCYTLRLITKTIDIQWKEIIQIISLILMGVIRNEHATFFQIHQMYTEYNTSKNDTDLHLPTCTHTRTHAYIKYFVYLTEREKIP